MTARRPDLDDIQAAAKSIAGVTLRTPLVASALPGSEGRLWLKLETLQPSGAFKLRGATNAIARLTPEARARGVVCCSTGNHGTALAHAARALGVDATVCVSHLVPAVKLRAIEERGARVIRSGQSQDEAQSEADRRVDAEGLTDIPPFDHPDVIAGQATIGLELIADLASLDCVLVPLSGGGLAGGIALAVKALNPRVRVIGLSMDRGAAMAESLRAGRPVEVTEVASLADSLGGGIGRDNRLTYALCRDTLDDVILLTEDEIYRGMQSLFRDDRLVGEGAAAVAHAAVLAGKVRLSGNTAAIVSGRNVDMEQFSDVIAGRPVRLGELTVGATQTGRDRR